MTDERREDGRQQPGVFDDDRLLACALGFEDDPELDAAAASDPGLAERLAAMRAEVATVGKKIDLAVPDPAKDYGDPAGARWAGLREYFEPPAPVPRRASRWLRVAAPVAAVAVLALAVGLVAVNRDGGSSGSSSSMQRSTEVDSTASGAVPAPATGAAPTFAEQLDEFAVVVLARARAATGGFQRFGVVRALKGVAPDVLSLKVDGQPAVRGRLHLLMLQPLASAAAREMQQALVQGPAPAKSTGAGPGKPLQVAYTYQGEPALARELPVGTDPAAVSLP